MTRFSRAAEKIRPYIDRLRAVLSILLVAGCIASVLLVYIRAFYGTEITDEAYYVAEALGVLNGNIPYAYNNSFIGVGFTFPEIPFLFLYKLLVPSCEGIFLFSRLCFLTFKLITLFAVFLCLRRRIRSIYLVIFLTGVFTYSSQIENFSYNSIPPVLIVLAGAVMFNSVEGAERPKKLPVFISGFICGVAVFSNPVYAAGVLLILLLVVIRSRNEERLENTLFFVLGGLTAIVLVFVPIILQTGFRKFWIGFYTMLPGVISVDPLSTTSSAEKLEMLLEILKEYLYILPVSVSGWLISLIIVKIVKKNLNSDIPQQVLMLMLAVCICIGLKAHFAEKAGWDTVEMIGVMSAVLLLPALLLGLTKKDPILLYIGLAPVFCVFITIFGSSSGSVLRRFGTALYSLHVLLLILMKNGWRPIKFVAILCAAACIYLQVNTLYKVPYRDAEFQELTTRVETGVYKGIFTTQQRAKDLPELENYLNERITEDDFYAFRDNVPCAYLMTHRGTVCESSSWDVMQYTYHRNAPKLLYSYYQRRDNIPDLIIYIDYGRDAALSIETDWYRYNEWVDTYYDKTEDVALNDTFSHVIVYRYNGTFDGDYDRWIGN